MKTYTIKHDGSEYSATFTPGPIRPCQQTVTGIWRDFVNGCEVFVNESLTIPAEWLDEMEVML
jgi:hypothetical protein